MSRNLDDAAMPTDRTAQPPPGSLLPMGRRLALGASLSLLTTRPARPETPQRAWAEFRSRFVSRDGRVMDTGNHNVSHSEGQGYGLLLAAAYDTEPMFMQILDWTRRNLCRGEDHLLSWRWRPEAPGRDRGDLNNAADGDLLGAWALCRAAVRWHNRDCLGLAKAMAADFLRFNTVDVNGQLLMRPGTTGFDHREHLVVNPSYAVFPAMRELNAMQPDPRWRRLEAGMLDLMAHARFGQRQLTADWVEVPRSGGRYRIASEWPPRFSWDAVRIPLYMTWAGLAKDPSLDPLMAVWFDPMRGAAPPAWWDLRNESPAPYEATPGIIAVARLLLAARLGQAQQHPLPLPAVSEAADYYNAALVLLCRLAADEGRLNLAMAEAALP